MRGNHAAFRVWQQTEAVGPTFVASLIEGVQLTERTQPGTKNTGWMPELDGCRAVAALSVVAAHFAPGSYFNEFASANLGVTTFYSLSAFLLTYLAAREQLNTGRINIGRFFVRRIFRIWPLYFTALVIAFLISSPWGAVGGTQPWSDGFTWFERQGWWFLAFLTNLAMAFNQVDTFSFTAPDPMLVTWSIALEEQMYLLFPFVFIFMVRTKALPLAAALVILGLLARSMFLFLPVSNPEVGPRGGMYYFSLSYVEVFLAGGMAGWIVAHRSDPRYASLVNHFQCRWIGVFLLVFLGLCGVMWAPVLWYPYHWAVPFLYSLMAVVLAAMLVWLVVNPGSLMSRFLRTKAIRVLGVLSYGIYLWHLVVFSVLRTYLDGSVQRFAMEKSIASVLEFVHAISVVVAVSVIGYVAVEKPFLALKNRIGRSDTRNAPADDSMRLLPSFLFTMGIIIAFELIYWKTPPVLGLFKLD